MRELNQVQIKTKIDQFFESYEKTFGEPANHNIVAFLIDSHLDDKRKDYVIKFLGDFKEGTLVNLNKALQDEAKRRNNAAIKANPPSIQLAGAEIRVDTPEKPKRKRRKRSDAGKSRKDNSGAVQDI